MKSNALLNQSGNNFYACDLKGAKSLLERGLDLAFGFVTLVFCHSSFSLSFMIIPVRFQGSWTTFSFFPCYLNLVFIYDSHYLRLWLLHHCHLLSALKILLLSLSISPSICEAVDREKERTLKFKRLRFIYMNFVYDKEGMRLMEEAIPSCNKSG
ncbi:hypothetical protein V8G54_028924, partial [Vigna mungo]